MRIEESTGYALPLMNSHSITESLHEQTKKKVCRKNQFYEILVRLNDLMRQDRKLLILWPEC